MTCDHTQHRDLPIGCGLHERIGQQPDGTWRRCEQNRPGKGAHSHADAPNPPAWIPGPGEAHRRSQPLATADDLRRIAHRGPTRPNDRDRLEALADLIEGQP